MKILKKSGDPRGTLYNHFKVPTAPKKSINVKIAFLASALGPLDRLAEALGPLACLAAVLGPLAAELGPLAWL